ncbi:hypothetical protein ABUW04_34885 [Streptacidiphilus sp. N1-10]|uniref:DUF4226 domain-containing protein n=1 Tax=Streptacidiphilus jeojiensis TaxID=3229225 RepID=A0ABV6XYV1_9ACTN
MSAGGEEKAVFHALKADAEKSLPKIAEKHAGLVDSTVEKGTRNLAEHAANEQELSDAFRSKMPKDDPLTEPKPSEPGSGGSRISQALDSGAAPDLEAGAPQLGRDALHDSPDFNTQIDQELNARGLDRTEHDRLRTSPTNDLTDEQIQQVVDVRNSIKIADGQIVTKVLGPDIAKSYLKNAKVLPDGGAFDSTRFGGSIARGTDTAGLTTPSDLRDALALDDKGAGWSPVPEDAAEAYQLRLKAPEGMDAATTFGAVDDPAAAQHVADLAGASKGRPWHDPFTGTGYTGGGIPEWEAARTLVPPGAEIWRMTPDGGESLAGYYDGNKWIGTNG